MIRQRLARARLLLILVVGWSAVLWAVVAVLAVYVANRVLQWTGAVQLSPVLPPLAGLAALGAIGYRLHLNRMVRSSHRFALWVEEQVGGLDHALVSAADESLTSPERHPALFQRAAEVDPVGPVRRAAIGAIGRPAFICLVLGGLLAAVAPGIRSPGNSTGTSASQVELPSRLADFSVLIEPPGYSHLPGTSLSSPQSVTALVGSRLVIGGSGTSAGLVARLGDDTLNATALGSRWQLSTVMPAQPMVITLIDRTERRLVALVPVPDSIPIVRLQAPATDTTYETVPRGTLAIESTIRDDIGLASAQVEYMISTGSDEEFQTRIVNGGRHTFDGARTGAFREVVRFDTLNLSPGSVLHVRVVAFDQNTLTGPGRGVSETRTLRIAEPVDTSAAEATPPPPIDSMFISQRLLNMKTDTLIAVRGRLRSDTVAARSDAYSGIQESLRQHTLSVISEIEGDPDDPASTITATTRRLRQVAEMMVTARTHLAAAEPGAAIPFMRRILATLDSIRLSNRYYQRGQARAKPVNLARIRLTGVDPAGHAIRNPRLAEPDLLEQLARRLDHVAELAARTPAAARDTLTLIRVEAARQAPAVGALLGAALDRIGRGTSIDSALGPVRRALRPPPILGTGPVDWAPVQ